MAKQLKIVKRPTAKNAPKERSYWSGLEAEEIIQRVAAGEGLVDEAERLDVQVDPDTAMVWLRRNKYNRKVSPSTVNRFAEDMLVGAWPYTHQGIAFDRQGYLLDGQHRLHAIVQSGSTIAMQVTVNMPPETRRAIDQGKNRTVADVATLEAKRPIEVAMTAVGVRMQLSVTLIKNPRSRTEQVDFILKHLQAILFSIEQLPQKAQRIAYGATRAVIARAYYSVDRQVLERFCTILREGSYTTNEESAVFMLREWIMRKGCQSRLDARELYCRTEWILQRFIEKQRKPERLKATEKELFPIPDDPEKEPLRL